LRRSALAQDRHKAKKHIEMTVEMIQCEHLMNANEVSMNLVNSYVYQIERKK
jgi:hypothetical protein